MSDEERSNLPPKFLDWRRRARDTREKAKARLIPGLQMSRAGIEEDVVPMGYLLFRDRNDPVIGSFIKKDLEEFMSPKNPDEARACFQYTVECILEPQDRRTAMNLITEGTSAMWFMEYLALTQPTDEWEPPDMDEDDVMAKIKTYEEGHPGRGLYNLTRHWNNIKDSDLFQPHRKADKEANRADAAEAKLAGIDIAEYRRRKDEQEAEAARKRRTPQLIQRGRALAKRMQPFTMDGSTESIRFGYQVQGDPWVACSIDLNDHLAEHLLTFRAKKRK